MKIICKETISKNFDLKEVITAKSNNFDYGNFGLKLNRKYLVFGFLIYKASNCIYYLVDLDGWPYWFPSPLFDVISNDIPKNWFITIYPRSSPHNIYIICGFNELCNNEFFYDRLWEAEENAMAIFYKRKIEMELEEYVKFPDLSIKQKAAILDDAWLYCPNCTDGWKSTSTSAMVICDNCKQALHNPRYAN